MEVGLCIKSVFRDLRPRRSPFAAHIPKIPSTSCFPRKSSCKANDRNGSSLGIVRRFLGHSINVVTILCAVDGRLTNKWHDFEEYT